MNKKIFENARFIPKGDVEKNWKKATGFIPLDKEIIIYKPDENYSYARIKIGDGKTGVNDLPFVVNADGKFANKDWVSLQLSIAEKKTENYVDNATQGLATENYVDNATQGLATEAWVNEGFETARAAVQQYVDKSVQGFVNKEYVDNAVAAIPEIQDTIAELEGRITEVTFNITESNTTISLSVSTSSTNFKVDWGDGNISYKNTAHTYKKIGEYKCKVYDVYAISLKNCINLVSIIIPDSVTSIGERAFEGCSRLTSVVIPDSVTTIGEKAFSSCSSLTSIVIPDSVTTIGYSAFSGCSSLTSIEIPDSVTSIDAFAFAGCSALEEITIPFVGGTKKTASDTYQYPLGYIFGTSSYPGGTATTQAYYGSSIGSLISTTYYIPTSLKKVIITGGNILDYAFHNCENLTSVVIGDGVTTIGGYAFNYCRGLTSVVIPDSVTSIGNGAFTWCYILTSVVIPDSVTTIGESAFAPCDGLTSVTFKSLEPLTYVSSWFNYCWRLENIYVPYGCAETYKTKWAADGAEQDILDKIVESDREAMMSDFKTETWVFTLEDGTTVTKKIYVKE